MIENSVVNLRYSAEHFVFVTRILNWIEVFDDYKRSGSSLDEYYQNGFIKFLKGRYQNFTLPSFHSLKTHLSKIDIHGKTYYCSKTSGAASDAFWKKIYLEYLSKGNGDVNDFYRNKHDEINVSKMTFIRHLDRARDLLGLPATTTAAAQSGNVTSKNQELKHTKKEDLKENFLKDEESIVIHQLTAEECQISQPKTLRLQNIKTIKATGTAKTTSLSTAKTVSIHYGELTLSFDTQTPEQSVASIIQELRRG